MFSSLRHSMKHDLNISDLCNHTLGTEKDASSVREYVYVTSLLWPPMYEYQLLLCERLPGHCFPVQGQPFCRSTTRNGLDSVMRQG